MHRIAFLLCVLLLFVLVRPINGQQFSVPEETLLAYVQAIYQPIELGTHRDAIDRRFCSAYDLLSEQTRSRISLREFVAAIWATRISSGHLGPFGAFTIQVVTYNEARTIAKVTFTVRLKSWVWGFVEGTQVSTLLKESDGIWRLLFPEEGVNELQRLVPRGSRHTPACSGVGPAPPTPSPAPVPTPTPDNPPGG